MFALVLALLNCCSVSTTQAFLNSKELSNGSGNELGKDGELLWDSLPAPAWYSVSTSAQPLLTPQLPTAACLRLHSTASSWARQPPSRAAPSTLAVIQATVWWDTAWPSVPDTLKATTCGVRPFLSVKVSSRGYSSSGGSAPSHLRLVSGAVGTTCESPRGWCWRGGDVRQEVTGKGSGVRGRLCQEPLGKKSQAPS